MASYVYNILGDVIDEAYNILAVDGDSNTFPGLSRTNFEKFANRFNKEFIDSVRLRTQESTSGFNTVADTTLSVLAAAGSLTLTITLSTGWPASGQCIVDSIPMTFTRSGSTLTVAATSRAFEAGDTVQLCYAVPTDFWRATGFFKAAQPMVYYRRGDWLDLPSFGYALYGDYFVLPRTTTNDEDVTVHYYKKPTATLASTDTMDIMEMWDDYIIYKLVAHGHSIMYDQARSQEYEMKAEQTKRKARSHFARIDGSLGNAFIPDW